MTSEVAPGLRERKKRALRTELSLAALRLAKERGLENVRTEDIVEAVGVSRRTFTNYFANKYEAIADRMVERAQMSATVLRGRPRTEPLWRALTASMVAPYEDLVLSDASAEGRASTLFVFEDPSLRAELWKGDFIAQQAIAEAIAERTKIDIALYPTLAAAIAITTVRTVVERWLRTKRPPPLVPMIREAFEQVAEGLPVPTRRNR